MPTPKHWEKWIREDAPKYDIDPRAALAVALMEGMSGRVGDGGHAFGPYQMNDAGGVLTGRPGNHRAYAESRRGINDALAAMARAGAAGKTGAAAINAIVRRYERPAAPDPEVAGAIARYGGISAGGGGSVGSFKAPGTGRATAQMASGSSGGGQADARLQLLSQLMQQNAQYASGQQGVPGQSQGGATSLIPALLAFRAAQEGQGADSGSEGDSGAPVQPGRAPNEGFVGFGTSGKIIGTPYSNTHTLGNWESDRAIDEALPYGTPIKAPFGGTIGSQFGPLNSSNPRMQGLRVHVVGKKNEAYLAHLSKFAPGIKPGVRVKPGQVIGYSGAANGVNHLHEALKYGDPYKLVKRT